MDKIAHRLEGLKGHQVNLSSTLHQENGEQQWVLGRKKPLPYKNNPLVFVKLANGHVDRLLEQCFAERNDQGRTLWF